MVKTSTSLLQGAALLRASCHRPTKMSSYRTAAEFRGFYKTPQSSALGSRRWPFLHFGVRFQHCCNPTELVAVKYDVYIVGSIMPRSTWFAGHGSSKVYPEPSQGRSGRCKWWQGQAAGSFCQGYIVAKSTFVSSWLWHPVSKTTPPGSGGVLRPVSALRCEASTIRLGLS